METPGQRMALDAKAVAALLEAQGIAIDARRAGKIAAALAGAISLSTKDAERFNPSLDTTLLAKAFEASKWRP